MATRKTAKSEDRGKQDQQRQASRTQWERWKRNAAKPEYGLPAFEVLHSVGKVSRLKYLESMLEMEEKFPGRGWKQCADNLHKFYFDLGLNLNDFKPRLEEFPIPF